MTTAEPAPRGGGLVLAAATLAVLAVSGIWSATQAREWVRATQAAKGNLWPDGEPIARDFVLFAGVAEAWRDGRIDTLYDPDQQARLMQQAAGLPNPHTKVNFNYPPFFAWLLRPLAPLDYMTRFWCWTALQLAFAAAALWAMRREFAGQPGAVLAIAAFAVAPATQQTLILGHAAFLGLAASAWGWRLLREGREFWAGMCVSLLFYKPTLGIGFAAVLLGKRRWRAVAGVAAGAAVLLAASVAASPQATWEFPQRLRESARLTADQPGFLAKMHCFLAAPAQWTGKPPSAFGLAENAAWAGPSLALALALAWAWRGPWEPTSDGFAQAAAATVLATQAMAPYLFFYDTALSSLALALSLRTLPRRPEWHSWAVLACVAAAWLGVAGVTPPPALGFTPTPFALGLWAALEAWTAGAAVSRRAASPTS